MSRAASGSPRSVLLCAITLGFLATVAGLVVMWRTASSEMLLERGNRAFHKGDYAEAVLWAERALNRDRESSAARLLGAQALAASGRFEEAVRRCEPIPVDESSESIAADLLCGEILLQRLALIGPAEARFRRVLDRQPEHPVAVEQMAYLLTLQTRSREAIHYQLLMMRGRSVTLPGVYSLALGTQLYPDESLMQRFHEADAEAAGPLLGLAQLAILRRDFERAEWLLTRAVRNQPEMHEAQARLGLVLLEVESPTQVELWHRNLPASAAAHPVIWEVRGRLALARRDVAGAARCFWEALRRDANLPTSNYQLGQCLVASDRQEDGELFLERARRLERYKLLVDPGHVTGGAFDFTTETCRQAADLCEGLSLPWEEYGWSFLAAVKQGSPPGWALRRIQRLEPHLASLPLERALPEANPASNIDLSDLSLPGWLTEGPLLEQKQPSRAPDAAPGPGVIRFEDEAAAAGIDFTYFNDSNPRVSGMHRTIEFTGGGVAALDYDGDGWPDLYFTQGAEFPEQRAEFAHVDRLFRNRGDGRFEDVTHSAGLAEELYGQGIAVGDFNNDGFPDLFVANIGPNRLLVNNGDGTFSDVSELLPPGQQRWTTSAVIADLDGDGMPEIYAVNYLSGREVFTRTCRDEHGFRARCTPRDFPAAQDQLYWNRGDGRFEDVTRTSGITARDGKGLGIVAADFHGAGRLDLFVANDTVANFFFENLTSSAQGPPRLEERALPYGIAYNEAGRGEACMGVVAEDFNGNGRLDLFVTNFADESNTLYVQHSGLVFTDETRAAGLHEPTLPMLGFGAQAVDAELNGVPDLLVTNGHIDDYTHAGQLYEMPPQYFQNDGAGRFVELNGSQIGPYFEGRYLGRSMARVDWNRDGAEDVVISHLDAPAALLTNTTQPRGHYAAVRLVGTSSSRDAIGTIVTVRTPQRSLTRQLIAGDGYQSSNQRQLVFGLGDFSEAVSVDVRWTSGAIQQFDDVPTDCELIIVEGAASPFLLNAR